MDRGNLLLDTASALQPYHPCALIGTTPALPRVRCAREGGGVDQVGRVEKDRAGERRVSSPSPFLSTNRAAPSGNLPRKSSPLYG
jgi:hypothetical protein